MHIIYTIYILTDWLTNRRWQRQHLWWWRWWLQWWWWWWNISLFYKFTYTIGILYHVLLLGLPTEFMWPCIPTETKRDRQTDKQTYGESGSCILHNLLKKNWLWSFRTDHRSKLLLTPRYRTSAASTNTDEHKDRHTRIQTDRHTIRKTDTNRRREINRRLSWVFSIELDGQDVENSDGPGVNPKHHHHHHHHYHHHYHQPVSPSRASPMTFLDVDWTTDH